MRHGVAAKCLGHILELVRHEPGQGDAREGEGVDPHVANLSPAGNAFDEGPVAGRVVSKHGCATNELRQTCDRFFWRRGIGDISIRNVRQRRDVLWYRHAWVYEGAEGLHHFPPTQAGCGNLRKLAIRER